MVEVFYLSHIALKIDSLTSIESADCTAKAFYNHLNLTTLKRITTYLLLTAGLLLTACSSSDDDPSGPESTAITLSVSSENILLGQSVSYTVVDNLGNDLTTAAIVKIGGVQITENPYTFTSVGSFQITAFYQSLTPSVAVVNVEYPAPTSISLSTVEQAFLVGESLDKGTDLTVIDSNGIDITTAAVITVNGVEMTGSAYAFTSEDNYEIQASYQSLSSNTVAVTAQTPHSTKILLSDFTGTWCGYCPVAGAAIHNAKAASSQVIPVAFHIGDAMENTDASAVDSHFGISQYPTVLLNGAAATWSYPNLPFSQLETALAVPQPLGLAIQSTVNGTSLDITVKVHHTLVRATDLKLAVYLLEDGIVASQSNYVYDNHPDPWTDYVHDDVLRKAYTAPLGDAIPASGVVAGAEYVKTFTSVAIPGSVVDNQQLKIVAYVANANNEVINVQTAALGAVVAFD